MLNSATLKSDPQQHSQNLEVCWEKQESLSLPQLPPKQNLHFNRIPPGDWSTD